MSECNKVRDLLALRSDDWNADEGRRVQIHLEICADCAALAHTYAQQDHLLRAKHHVRLSPSQRDQLLAQIQRERRRHHVRTVLSSVVGAAALTVVLIAFTIGLFALFSDTDRPDVGAPLVPPPTDTVEPTKAPEPLVFADEIRLEQTVPLLADGPVPLTLSVPDGQDSPAPGQLQVPTNISFTLTWQVMSPPSADWQVFVHMLNAAQQLVMQSDVIVDWDEQTCAEDEQGIACFTNTTHGLDLPADLVPGLYTFVVGLYDPATTARASVINRTGVTSSQVELGQVQVVSGLSDSDRAEVTLHTFSGRPNPTWALTPEQDAELRTRIDVLPVTDLAYDEITGLGYTGLGLLLPGIDGQKARRATVWNGVVQVEEEGRTELLADEGRVLERWLLETGAWQVDKEVLDFVRMELVPLPPVTPSLEPFRAPEGEFAIFFTVEPTPVTLLPQASLDTLELEAEPFIAAADILRYSEETHEIQLTPGAVERLNQLDVPTLGRGFVVAVGDERIYNGGVWTMASSLSFDGVVIVVPLINQSLRVQLGYPESPELFEGEDPRSDVRIMESLEREGKLD